jgi:hypothetical protein
MTVDFQHSTCYGAAIGNARTPRRWSGTFADRALNVDAAEAAEERDDEDWFWVRRTPVMTTAVRLLAAGEKFFFL